MHNKALLSIGKFCDNGYTVMLTKDKIKLKCNHDAKLIIERQRNKNNGMRLISLENVVKD